jgi:hypothetical protein
MSQKSDKRLIAGMIKGRQKGKPKSHTGIQKKNGRELVPLVVGIAKMQVWAELASLFVIDAWHNYRGKNL